MTGKTTVGVIGCGYWGPNLLRNFAENESAELRWLCDLDQNRLHTLGRRYPAVKTTTDYKQLLADPQVSAVAIATPVWTHFSFAREALEAGKHVLVEKPLGASSEEAAEGLRAFEQKRAPDFARFRAHASEPI